MLSLQKGESYSVSFSGLTLSGLQSLSMQKRRLTTANFSRFLIVFGQIFATCRLVVTQKMLLKNSIIRSIYIRLLTMVPEMEKRLLSGREVSIRNDLCGSDVISSFEMARDSSDQLQRAENAMKFILETSLLRLSQRFSRNGI